MDKFRNIKLNNPGNCVLNNVVDKDVQLMLRPWNLMQFLSCTPRYRIRNDRITPTNFISSFYSIIGATVFISSNIFRAYMLFRYKDGVRFTKSMTISFLTDCIYYCFGFILNFVIGISQIKNNIKFVLIFQRLHRLLNNETSFSHFIIWNWIMVIMGLSYYFTVLCYFTIQVTIPWFYAIVNYLLFVFDFNVVYAIRVIELLQSKLELWNIQVLNSRVMEETRGEDFSKRMFEAYSDIIECYGICKVCVQPFILYYIVEGFLHSLIYIQVTIEEFKNETIHATTITTLLSLLCWLSKDLMWQTMFIQRCETFYLAVQSVRDTCAVVLKSNCSDDEKKLCKNVLRLHRASFSKMRVCGLFYADVALQLSLMALLANYTIVLLQFAFL